MATIQTGSGETFKTTIAEGRLIEAACFLKVQELEPTKNPIERNSVLGEFSISSMEFSGTYNLICSQVLTPSGGISIVATPYLTGVSFSPGSGSPTFKSTTPEAYLLEVITYLQSLEATAAKNPNGLNQISGTYNADTGVYSGNFVIPLSIAFDASGSIDFTAREYLLT